MATSGIVTADQTVGTEPNLVDVLQPVSELRLTIGSLVSQIMRAKTKPLGIFIQFGDVRRVAFMRSQQDLALTSDLGNVPIGSLGIAVYNAELTGNANKAYDRAGVSGHDESVVSSFSSAFDAVDNLLVAASKPRLSLTGVIARVEDAEQLAKAQEQMPSGEHLAMFVDQRNSQIKVFSLADSYAFDVSQFNEGVNSTAELLSLVSVGGTARSASNSAGNEGFFESGVEQPV